jgi:type III secretion protein C
VRFLTTLIAAAALASMQPAAAADATPFSGKRFVYRADGKKLPDVLQDFAASQGIPVVVDSGVDGSVNANFNTRPEDFLNAMTRTYGVIWYFDGTTLFVYPSRAMQSRVFRMRGYDRQQVRSMLGSLGLGDARFPLKFDDRQQTLLAYGPPRHIELVSTVLEQLERDGHDRVGKSIQVFPLRFATAGDRVFGNAKVPGLASTLNNLFSNNSGSGANGSNQALKGAVNGMVGNANKARAAQATYGLKLPETGGGSNANKRDDEVRANQLSSSDALTPADAERPYFQAEEATNAIIVRGLPDRMREYETLIRQLDIAQDLVEIEATIIDVSSDAFESLGVDWTFTKDGVTRLTVSPGSPGAQPGTAGSSTLAGSNVTTLVGNAGKQLLARIRALEGTGKANILARPKVLGAVNRTASMTDKRVASVRVAGNLDANLFTIEAGTTLQVTPQIVSYADHREVRLSLSIQDGNFEGTVVDSVPIIKQTEINTEATVREGESLLIGGISIESNSKGRSGLPGLSRIPLLGAAFRHDENASFRSERLFLLTPKVIGVGRAAATPTVPTPVPAPAPAPTPAPVPDLPAPLAPPPSSSPTPRTGSTQRGFSGPTAVAALTTYGALSPGYVIPTLKPLLTPRAALFPGSTAPAPTVAANTATTAAPTRTAAATTGKASKATAPKPGCAAQAMGLATGCDTKGAR